MDPGNKKAAFQIALRILRDFESWQTWSIDERIAATSFAQCPHSNRLHFIVFACLGSERDKEELKLDLNETILFKRYRRRLEQLWHELTTHVPMPLELLILLPDLEPTRTWGWNIPQSELTTLCQMMIEDTAHTLPAGWIVRCWSEIEAEPPLRQTPTYTDVLTWARTEAHRSLIKEERAFFEQLGKTHPDILTRRTPQELAMRQVAAYAHEGHCLDQLFGESFILLQADHPIERKDRMFQERCRNGLNIAHPFLSR